MIPIKLTIATKHVLPVNNRNLSLFDRFRQDTMDAIDSAMDAAADAVMDEYETDPCTLDGDFCDETEPEELSPEAIRQKLEALIDECFSGPEDSENTGRYIFTTEAAMEVTPGEITITYEEAPGSDLGQTQSILRIHRNQAHSLSIQRTGSLMNTLICEKGRRHTSVYTSPMIPAPLEVCTYTRRCDIDLDEEGGVIFLDYIIEIHGADVQRTTIRMNITPLEDRA